MGQTYVLPTARIGFVIISRSVRRRSVGPARLEVQGGLLGFFFFGLQSGFNDLFSRACRYQQAFGICRYPQISAGIFKSP